MFCQDNVAIRVAKTCLLYFMVMIAVSFIFGNLLTCPRYCISNYAVLVLFVASSCVGLISQVKGLKEFKKWWAYASVAVIIVMFIPYFLYYPGWGLTFATREGLAVVMEEIDTNQNVLVASNCPDMMTVYAGDRDNYYIFRSEKNVDSYHFDSDGIVVGDGWSPMFGSVKSINAALDFFDDDGQICFIGCKPSKIDAELVDFFVDLGVFENTVILSKNEFRERFLEYLNLINAG